MSIDNCGDSITVMSTISNSGDGGSIPTSPLQMRLDDINFILAKSLNKAWHSRFPEIGAGFTDKVKYMCFGAKYEIKFYGIAIWSRPVARNIPVDSWLELRRLAISPNAPKYTASWMISLMVKIIKKRRPDITTLFSYQDTDVHTGTIYKASGWKSTIISSGGEWNCKARASNKVQSASKKQRWELVIR